MGRNTSFIKLEGTLDGLTFYEKDGVNFVKKQSKISKSRILNDPAFKRTRENMQEFAGAARAGKAFRQAFGNVVSLMGDTYLSGRLSALMKRINRNGSGIRGERPIDVTANSEQLSNFEFNKKAPFGAIFFPKYEAPTFNANRDVATWTIPDFDVDSFVKSPEGATHFRLVLSLGLVSNYEYKAELDEYDPVSPEENGKGITEFSADIPVKGSVGAVTTLTADLGYGAAVPATVLALAAIGIVFYQEVDGKMYELAQDNAMQIGAVL